jgi:2-amino-4-hydroxy-6-hydroxymethyldihydropteridine diphosphokinase
MTKAFIALGANLGRRQTALRAALRRMNEIPATRVVCIARFRETDPVDAPAGSRAFINSVAEIETDLAAPELFEQLQKIEMALGRDRSRGGANAPRTIDLDVLIFGNDIISSPILNVPHPRMFHRLFVLEPLAEIAPELVDPVSGKRVREKLEELQARLAAVNS